MKTIRMDGFSIKKYNGKGANLSDAFAGRRFHNNVFYDVFYNGITLNNSTVVEIKKSPKQIRKRYWK